MIQNNVTSSQSLINYKKDDKKSEVSGAKGGKSMKDKEKLNQVCQFELNISSEQIDDVEYNVISK